MRILVAPDSFKGSLSADEVARCMADGFRRAIAQAQVFECPMADGGEGTADVLARSRGGRRRTARVTSALGTPVHAAYYLVSAGPTALVDVAAASGVGRIPMRRRNPWTATSTGTGELVARAIAQGARAVQLALGGSATVDGGIGLLTALGARVLDENGRAVPPGGQGLAAARRVDLGALRTRVSGVAFTALCDVTSPLLGPHGAARMFGPQKGADPAMVERLETGMVRWAEILERATGRPGTRERAGAGSAGGIGFALAAALGAQLQPGGPTVLAAVRFERRLEHIDLVVTGEGRLDGQTLRGKLVARVAEAAAGRSVPVIAIVGALGEGWEEAAARLDGVFPLSMDSPSRRPARAAASPRLETAAYRVASLLALGGRIGHRHGPGRRGDPAPAP